MTYYRTDLAWIHHVGYAQHVEQTRTGITALLTRHGLEAGNRVLDVGCGSGLLARHLLASGFDVHGVDGSPAMIELAREYASHARFDVLRLPSRQSPGIDGALPMADAVVSTGHVLNYLDSRDDISQALRELAGAVRPGGILAIDLMTEAFCDARDLSQPHCRVENDWALVTRFSRPGKQRFDRHITLFRLVDGNWRRSEEHHRNVTYAADDALRILEEAGLTVRLQPAFGDELLPTGLVVLVGIRNQAGYFA